VNYLLFIETEERPFAGGLKQQQQLSDATTTRGKNRKKLGHGTRKERIFRIRARKENTTTKRRR